MTDPAAPSNRSGSNGGVAGWTEGASVPAFVKAPVDQRPPSTPASELVQAPDPKLTGDPATGGRRRLAPVPNSGRDALAPQVSGAGPRTPFFVNQGAGSPTTALSAMAFAPQLGRVTTPFAATKTAREGQAETILRANGAWGPPRDGEVFLIQIDVDNPPASATAAERMKWLQAYTGETVLFVARGGRLVEKNPKGPFASASHPGQTTAKKKGAFTSVDGDLIADMAHLRPGAYRYLSDPSLDDAGKRRINPTRDLPVARDLNHDGVISGANEDNLLFRGSAMQIHAGGPWTPISAGCQTLPPRHFDILLELLKESGEKEFTYVLVRRPRPAA